MSSAKLFFLLPLFLNQCTAQPPCSGRIELPADGSWKNVVYLIQPRSFAEVAASFGGQVVDSATVQADGSFVFRKMPDAPQPILLELAVQKLGERFPTRLLDSNPALANYFPFVWQNGQKLEVSAAGERLQASFSIKNPSAENAALLQLRDLRITGFQQFLAGKFDDAPDENTLLDHETALRNFQKPLRHFADSCPSLLPALVAIRWVSPAGDFERVPEFLVRQADRWRAKSHENQWVAQLAQLASREKLPLLIGDHVPNLPLPMLSGDTVLLRKMRGKHLTLLDFWASWCAPCRRETREFLVPIWEANHAKGFQIIGYALDSNRETWQKAIEKDGAARWPHASHLRGDDAPLLQALRLTTIPANFLLDAEGRVLAKNLHGEALRAFVEGYLR